MKQAVFVTVLIVIWMVGCNSNPNSMGNTPVSSTTPLSTLPHSMKGYELYSWQKETGQWHFTLISGTNRVKSLEEITGGENIVTSEGWVRISVQGLEAIKGVLGSLPQSEEIFWISPPQPLGQGEFQDGQIALPSREVVEVIMEECKQLGLELSVN